MQVHLPIAGVTIDAFAILLMGGGVGFLSGLFGVGGGFLMTPLLIFLGISPAVAVGTQANQLVAASVSGVFAHLRRKNVDLKLGLVMMVGGGTGSVAGVFIFRWLQGLGQVDLVISILYVLFLGGIGSLMAWESLGTLLRRRAGRPTRGRLHQHTFLHGLPFKMRFPRSRLYMSALLPAGIGFLGGLLVAILGIGGGFILVPAMIYVLNMPAALVAGTSLFQIIFSTALSTVLQAAVNGTVDLVLAALLIVGGVVGAQFGASAGNLLRGEQARALLALLVLGVATKLLFDLIAPPRELYDLVVLPR